MTPLDDLPDWSFVAALASLGDSTRLRLAALLASDPRESWGALVRDRGLDPSLPRRCHDVCLEQGIDVIARDDERFPALLALDPVPPTVLFVRGDLSVLEGRRAAVIGTRNATRSGRHFAHMLGEDLGAAGVSVVSGLARGIDGEAHAGALAAAVNGSPAAPPVGVVASGLDVVYPREHARLWDAVADTGVLISEAPPGAPPEPYRFPQRNRIVAALAEVVVVVESAARGGSMLTVREAIQRGIDVMAVPGAPGVRTAEGANNLLRDGCAPVTDVDDVLVALGLSTAGGVTDRRSPPRGAAATVLRAMGHEPVTIEDLASRTSMPVLEVAIALGELRELGWAESTAEWWEALVSRA